MRKKRGAYHHGDLVRALLGAALAIVAKDGISGLSLRDVARRLGVSHQAPYRHFRDKRALLDAIAAEGFENLTRELRATAASHVPPARCVIACGFTYVTFAREHPAHYRVMFAEPASAQGSPPAENEGGTAYHVLLEAIVRGQREGVFVADPAHELALACFAYVHGLAMLVIDGKLPPLSDPALRALLRHQVRGITRELTSG